MLYRSPLLFYRGAPAAQPRVALAGLRTRLAGGLLAAVVRWDAAGMAVVAFLMGNAELFGQAHPFGLAFAVALLALGMTRAALAAALGALAAAAFLGQPGLVAYQAVVLAIAWGIARRVPDGRALVYLLPLGVLLGGGAARAGAALAAGASPVALGAHLAAAAVELACVLIFLPVAATLKHWPREFRGAQLAGLTVLGAATALGMWTVTVGPLNAGEVLARWGLLVGALAGGPGPGAAIGVGLGLVGGLSATGWPLAHWIWPVSGMLAGVGRPYGKAGACFGLLVGHLLATAQAASAAEIRAWFLHVGTAALLLLLTPGRLWQRLPEFMPGAGGRAAPAAPGAREERQAGRETAGRLKRVAAVFEELARAFSVADEIRAPRQDGFQRFLRGVSQRACAGCSSFRHCWEDNFFHQCRDLMELAATLEGRGRAVRHDLPGGLRARCIQPDLLVQAANRSMETLRMEAQWHLRVHESREIVPRQLRGLGSIIDNLADHLSRASEVTPDPADSPLSLQRRYDLRLTVLRRARDGNVVSGDVFGRIELGASRAGLVLSDGMGAGERAAAESEAAVGLLRRLLEAGFDPEFAIRTINSALLLRSPEETFATVDLCIVDLATGEADFIKIGAAPSFIRRDGDSREVDVVRGEALPVGILSRIEVAPQRKVLRPGDMLVMATDGLLDAGQSAEREEWVVRALRHMDTPDPEDCARRLLRRAHETADPARDDISVLCASLARVPQHALYGDKGPREAAPAASGAVPPDLA